MSKEVPESFKDSRNSEDRIVFSTFSVFNKNTKAAKHGVGNNIPDIQFAAMAEKAGQNPHADNKKAQETHASQNFLEEFKDYGFRIFHKFFSFTGE